MIKYELTEKVDVLSKDFLKGKMKNDTEIFVFHGNKINKIETGTFDKYKSLKEVHYYGTIEDYIFKNVSCYFPNKPTIHLFLDSSETETKFIEIPANIEKIEPYCFENCSEIVSIKFLNDDAKIGKYAFSMCEHLEHVFLPQNIEIIEEGVFYRCEELEHIVVPSNIRVIKKWAFADCSSLESFIIPDSLEKLENAFYGCTSLREIDLKDNITSLSEGTFEGCPSLTKVVIRDNITSIETGTFKHPRLGDENEIEIYYHGSMQKWLYFSNKKVFQEVLRVHLFLDGSKEETTSIYYTGPLKMPDYAFTNCTSLKYINIIDGVTSLGRRAFADCMNLETLILPTSVKKFEEQVFDWCLNLKILFMGDENEIKETFEPFDIIAFDLCELDIYSYKEEKPEQAGKYWHFVNDIPTIYE